MHRSRFVFLAMPARRVDGGAVAESVLWTLVSPNNRPLGRGPRLLATYAECRDAVLHLRQEHSRVEPLATAVEATGHWIWRVHLDGAVVAASSRSYLRLRECHYNLDLFLAAVPVADITAGTRAVRGGRRTDSPLRSPVR